MKKIMLGILLMTLFTGSALANPGWISGDVTTTTTNPHSYLIEIGQNGILQWSDNWHIDDTYTSCGLHRGYYTVRCTIYDDHGVSIAAQARTNVFVVPGQTTICSFYFSNGTALDRSTWGSIKATL